MHTPALTLLSLVSLLAWTNASVPIEGITANERNGLVKAYAYCKFTIKERQIKGAWKMTVNTNLPTKKIKVWIMKVTKRLDDGKKYEMKSRYEYWPQTIDVHFKLVYRKGAVPLSGTCSSNVESVSKEGSQGKITPTQNDAILPGSLTDIVEENFWKDYQTGMMIMQGKCYFPINEILKDFYVVVILDQETIAFKNWAATEYSKDPNGRWYIFKNNWTTRPSNMNFVFHVTYDSDKPPTGVCAIMTGDNPKPPATQKPNPIPTDTTTQLVTTPPQTTKHVVTTKKPTTNPPTTKKPTTNPPTTRKPTTNPPTTTQQSTSQSTQSLATTKSPVTTGSTHQGILNLYHKKYSGDGTYYGAGIEGTCSYNPPSLPPVARGHNMRYIALNRPQFFGSLACGMCFKVHGSGKGLGNDPITGDFVVFVKDLCPECLAGSIDLAENGDGRWGVDIQAVQCPVGNTKLEYKFQGSNPWYLKLQVRNSRIPVTEMSIWQPKSQRWSAMKHSTDGFWLMGTGLFEKPIHPSKSVPLKMKLTAANGAVVYDEITSMHNEVVIHGTGKQFPLDGSLPH